MSRNDQKKKWEIDRRSFLRGFGVTLALPALEVMMPSWARAAAARPQRLLMFYHPNGYPYAKWDGWKLKKGWKPGIDRLSKSLAGSFTTVSGLSNEPGAENDKLGGCGHGAGSVSLLSGAVAKKLGNHQWAVQTTFDQLIAQQIYGSRAMPSMGIILQEGSSLGGPYDPKYNQCMSWKGPGKPLDMYSNPRDVFNALFRAQSTSRALASGEIRTASDPRRDNVLDYVIDDIKRLQKNLGSSDKQKLDEYLTGVNELQKTMGDVENNDPNPGNPGGPTGGGCSSTGSAPADDNQQNLSTYAERMTIMQDLMVKAYECDMTRIFSFMVGCELLQVQRFVPGMKSKRDWHDLSHADNDDGQLADSTTVSLWYYDRFAELAAKLKKVRDVDGSSLYDNTLMMMYSNVHGDGGSHNKYWGQVTLAGGASGKLKLSNPDLNLGNNARPLADLWLTILNSFGVQKSSFGNSKGTISQLKV